jgi:hypothetical protein
VHSCQFFRFFQECFGDSCVGVFGSFSQFGQEGGFDSLSPEESPGVGGDLVDQNALGFVGRSVGGVKALAEIFVCRGIFAGDDDLGSGESVTKSVPASGLLAFGGFGSGAALCVLAIGEDLCG